MNRTPHPSPASRPPPGPATDERCSGYQLADPHRPGRIVSATTPDDVRVAVTDTAARGVPYAVQASGHGRRRSLEGGVLISTAALDRVRVDPAARTATVQAGATWRQVIDAAAPYGLAPPSGSAPGVGVAGYLLGGGLGLLAREFGYASDHVRWLEVVTLGGRALRATADSEPEWFWALRGGGHGLGAVVTELEIGLMPVERVWGGRLVFDADRLPGLLDTYPAWAETAPEGLTSSLALMVLPDVPFVPEELRGRHVGQVRIVWTGTPEEGERL
ncbi:hypothetical protein N566_13875, partial [Streptomycetaceae bacterium MP113-05]